MKPSREREVTRSGDDVEDENDADSLGSIDDDLVGIDSIGQDGSNAESVRTSIMDGIVTLSGSITKMSFVLDGYGITEDGNLHGEVCESSSYPMQCMHEGSWANLFRFDDRKNGSTVVAKILCDQFPDESTFERLRQERDMSALLSARCQFVRSLAAGMNINGDNNDETSSNQRIIFLEWIPGVNLRAWAKTQLSNVHLHDAGSLTHFDDCDHEEKRKLHLTVSISLAHQIATSVSEIHESGGAVLNNLSAEHIIINDAKGEQDDLSQEKEITIHIISLASASLIQKKPQSDGTNLPCEGIQHDLRSLGDVFFELFTGQNPYHLDPSGDSNGQHEEHLHLIPDALHHGEMNDTNHIGAKISNRRRSLKELRSILAVSLVPTYIEIFILELMEVLGPIEPGTEIRSDSVGNSRSSFYKSAREVSSHIMSIKAMSEDALFGQLDIGSNKLYGREDEKSKLLSAYERVVVHGGAGEVVLVSGLPGSGKTALVEQTAKQSLLVGKGHFLHIKFDTHSPIGGALSSILSVLKSFCHSMIASHGQTIDFEEKIGEEGLKMLANLIPAIYEIITTSKVDRIAGQNSGVSGTGLWMIQQQNQFNYIFRRFMSSIAGPESPVIIFFDDIQWADATSLNLIRSLILDLEKKPILVVESYRENEVENRYQLVSSHLHDLRKMSANMTEIQANNLKKSDIFQLLLDAMNLSSHDDTEPLANIIYRKTGGNALLVILFVKYLWDEGLLWFSFHQRCWQWDKNLLESKSIVQDAAGLIAQKIFALSAKTQLALKMMACIGSQCDKAILDIICSENDTDKHSFAMVQMLEAIQEGIVIEVGSNYKFAHDLIQSTAYSIIPDQSRSECHHRVGQKLLMASDTKEKIDKVLFVLVDQLNHGKQSIRNETERIDIAKLNCSAAEKAIASSMFSAALVYLEEGISLLDDEHWGSHFSLCYRLYKSYAETGFCSGNYEDAKKAVACILAHARCFNDKLPAYKVLVLILGIEKKGAEAFEIGKDVLIQLGEHFPTNPDETHILAELSKTKNMLEGKDIDVIMRKVMDAEHMLTITEFLETLCTLSTYCPSNLLALFNFRIIQLSISYGVCTSSIFGFASYSGNFFRLGDVQNGDKYAKLALNIMDSMGAWHKFCRISVLLYSFSYQTTERLHSCLNPLLKAYKDGLKAGDVTFASISAAFYCHMSFWCGINLPCLKGAIADIGREIKVYRLDLMWAPVLVLEQAVLNLMGQADNPSLLDGEVLDSNRFSSELKKANETRPLFVLYLYQMQVAYTFRDIEIASTMSDNLHNLGIDLRILLFLSFRPQLVFWDGLVSCSQARKTREEKWILRANENITQMRKIAQGISCNFQHRLFLLEAEFALIAGAKNEAKENFELAITASENNDFVQDHALSYELAGDFYSEQKDEHKTLQYYGKAHDAYLKWGAKGKADHLREHFPF